MCACKKQLRKYVAHIEWGSATMFIGIGALAGSLIMQSNQHYCLLLVAAFCLIVLFLIAAHNSYLQRSIDRVTQYERDFRHLVRERHNAARFCLGKGGKQYDVDEVLDFFDSPLGILTERGILDDELVYDFFFDWIRGYWSGCKAYLDGARREDNTLWEGMVSLHASVCLIHRRKRKEWALAKLRGDDLVEFLKKLESGAEDIIEGDELREFLEGEFEYCDQSSEKKDAP
jgi:hypothetical protein